MEALYFQRYHLIYFRHTTNESLYRWHWNQPPTKFATFDWLLHNFVIIISLFPCGIFRFIIVSVRGYSPSELLLYKNLIGSYH